MVFRLRRQRLFRGRCAKPFFCSVVRGASRPTAFATPVIFGWPGISACCGTNSRAKTSLSADQRGPKPEPVAEAALGRTKSPDCDALRLSSEIDGEVYWQENLLPGRVAPIRLSSEGNTWLRP